LSFTAVAVRSASHPPHKWRQRTVRPCLAHGIPPALTETATIPPPPLPPPNQATYWQRPSKHPPPRRRPHNSEIKKSKQNQPSAESSAEDPPPTAPPVIPVPPFISTALILRTPLRPAESRPAAPNREIVSEDLLIDVSQPSPPSATRAANTLLSVYRPPQPAITHCQSVIRHRTSDNTQPTYPRDPSGFTEYRSHERSPSSSESEWPNPFAARTNRPSEPDPEAFRALTISTPWKDSRPARALSLSRFRYLKNRAGSRRPTRAQSVEPFTRAATQEPFPARPTPPPIPPRPSTPTPPSIPLRINLPPRRPARTTKHRIGFRATEKEVVFDALQFLSNMNRDELQRYIADAVTVSVSAVLAAQLRPMRE